MATAALTNDCRLWPGMVRVRPRDEHGQAVGEYAILLAMVSGFHWPAAEGPHLLDQ